MAEKEEITLSPETEKLVRREAPTCFLCKWIVEDIEHNGKLTGHPVDYNGAGQFALTSKVAHVELLKRLEKEKSHVGE